MKPDLYPNGAAVIVNAPGTPHHMQLGHVRSTRLRNGNQRLYRVEFKRSGYEYVHSELNPPLVAVTRRAARLVKDHDIYLCEFQYTGCTKVHQCQLNPLTRQLLECISLQRFQLTSAQYALLLDLRDGEAVRFTQD